VECGLFASACITRLQSSTVLFFTAVAMTHIPTAAELEFEGLKSGKQIVAVVTGTSSGWWILSLWLGSVTPKTCKRHMRPEEHDRCAS